jgi:hypothetical protein
MLEATIVLQIILGQRLTASMIGFLYPKTRNATRAGRGFSPFTT